jgi:CHASE2 domain-containing sensor protein
LDSTLDLSDVFKDKIVLVGYLGNDEWNMPMKDKFYTPLNEQYAGRSLPDMYGLVIHANIIAMMLNGDYSFEMPGWITFMIEVLFCYANVLLFFWIYHHFKDPFHGITRGIQLLEFVLVFLLISILFHYFKIRIDFDTGILTLLLTYDFVMIYESLLKNRFKILQKL